MNKAQSIDQEDVSSFERIAEEWWDEQGSFRPLHQINPYRLTYIRETVADHYDFDAETLRCFDGLKILDIGCGGGLICEPLSRIGADVTGLDAGERNIEAAKIHAQQQGLSIDYKAQSAESLLEETGQAQKYDVVLALEILEHVNDPAEFVAMVQKFVKPGGIVLYSTLNKTLKSLAFGKIAAEYVLGLVPKGTHNWQQFIKPSQLARWVRASGGQEIKTCGLCYDVMKQNFKLVKHDLDINYFLSAKITDASPQQSKKKVT
jgi:2-polyprenyl-6-hydroxyphenyl methylase/3-demethylubiquinone-9 3-methyltransferase